MKKFIIILMMLVGLTTLCNAQVYWFKTTAFAQATITNGYYHWGNWESSDMQICANLNTDMITVYSPVTQVYRIYNYGTKNSDSSGGTQLIVKVIDQDNDRGEVRLRKEKNGNLQLYIDFADIAWVYNIKRIK